jgi:acyl carrier protein
MESKQARVDQPVAEASPVHQDPVLERLRRIVADDLDVNLAYDEVDPGAPLFEEGLALDSVVLVELISFVEKRFGIELHDDALNMQTFETLESLSRVIRRELQVQVPAQVPAPAQVQAQGS